jgi:hypothetical protein
MRSFRAVSTFFLLSAALWAADPFVGNWKLNVEKSDFGNMPKAQEGRTTYRANGGGYMFSSETVFSEDNVTRLGAPVQFDGTSNEGGINGRAVTFVSKKIDANNYEVIFTDRETRNISHTFRYTVSPQQNTLTFTWFRIGDVKPALMLVYDRQ